MNKQLEQRLRARVRKLVEAIVNEETPMPPPADDFKPKSVKPGVPVRMGKARVSYLQSGLVAIADESGNQAQLSEEDALKVANYIIRLSGKV